ncbi:hypothetical protein [Scytonema sp. PCC 10023]
MNIFQGFKTPHFTETAFVEEGSYAGGRGQKAQSDRRSTEPIVDTV